MSDDTWRDGAELPPVENGSMKEFIVAVRRVRNGKVYSFAASYLNAYGLNYESGCPKESEGCDGYQCEDGCPTTGWFRETGDDGEGSQFHQLELAEGDGLMGWRFVPQWPGNEKAAGHGRD